MEYEANRNQWEKLGLTKYEPRQLKLNVQRIAAFIVASKGLTKPSVLPTFLASLQNIHAPTSKRNVANALIDFFKYLIESNGIEGLGTRKLVKPQALIAHLEVYKKSLEKPMRKWRQTQQLRDFQQLPTQDDTKNARSRAIKEAESLLETG